MDFRNVVQLRKPLLSDLQVSMHSKKSNKIIDTIEFTSSHTPKYANCFRARNSDGISELRVEVELILPKRKILCRPEFSITVAFHV